MRLQWKLSLLGGTLLVAVAAWFAHVYVIGGWCGYYDGGPTGGPYSFCEQHVQSSNGDTWIATGTALLLGIGAVGALASRRTRTAVAWWLLRTVAALVCAVTVPFAFY